MSITFLNFFGFIYFPFVGASILPNQNKILANTEKQPMEKSYKGLTTPLVLYDNIIIPYINNSVNTFLKVF